MISSKDERDAQLFAAVIGGMTLKAAADSAGVTPERVRQIIFKLQRRMMSPERMDEPVPDGNWRSLVDLRAHSVFWLRRLKMLRAEHGSRDGGSIK